MNPLDARRRLLGRNVYKKTVEGNPAIATDSLARMYPGITMQGWTEQDSTTGANLFDIASATTGAVSRITGENLEYGKNWKRSDYIRVVSGQQYSCTYVANYQDTGFAFYDEQKTFLSGIPCTTNFTVPESAVFCRITVNTTDGDPNIFMFNAGSTALPYEPYTGGQPSPSPDYPQEIVSAGKYNEDTGKWEYDVEVGCGNLFNKGTANENKYIDNNSGLEYDGSGTYASDYINIFGFDNIRCTNTGSSQWMAFYNHEKIFISGVSGYGEAIPVPQNAMYARFTIKNSFINTFSVNAGSTLLPYTPYRPPQTVTLTADRPLTKWDKLEKRNGQWGWVYKSAEIESYTDESVPGEYYSTTGQLSTGAQMWYETTTETFVHLTASEQEAMNALHTFRPTTVLSNDCDCNMILTYKTKKSLEVTT